MEILDKLEGLVPRFEEVSTLITDPNVIGDQRRYVQLTKEYKNLEEIMHASQRSACHRRRPRHEGNGS